MVMKRRSGRGREGDTFASFEVPELFMPRGPKISCSTRSPQGTPPHLFLRHNGEKDREEESARIQKARERGENS